MPAPRRAMTAEFEAAYRAQFGFVWRALARHGVPMAALDDAVQEVFMVAHRHWGAWEGQASMRAWLFGVSRRVASTQLRARLRHDSKLRTMPQPGPEAALDERVEDRQRLDRLAAAIAVLPADRREVFVLADVEGLAAPEIAAALECNLNTVYSRLRRAREAIVTAMAPDERPAREGRGS
jgi:RNA polymerase sigma-70 factor, ECF subfamily